MRIHVVTKFGLQLFTLCLCFVGFASAEEIAFHAAFSGEEHKWIGEQVNLEFPGRESESTKDHLLTLPNGNKISYGDIISVGGDLYGIPELPICDGETFEDRVERFKAAFATLAEEEAMYRCDYDYCANKLIDVLEAESMKARDVVPGAPLPARGMDFLTAVHTYSAGNYIRLAIYNWDHFLPTSIKAYEAGHAAAIEQALRARDLEPGAEQNAALELAYAMNAFTDHYLTDMFSSGHVRVPRRQLYEQSTFASVAGLLAKQMHDEDGRVGLTVQNKSGTTWKMYGDGMLFIPEAEGNRVQVALALRTSVAEVSEAFKTGKAVPTEEYGLHKLMPLLDTDLMYPKNAELHSSPLYSLDKNGTVLARTPENSLCSYEWTSDWSGASQLLGYNSDGDGSDCKFNPQLEAHR